MAGRLDHFMPSSLIASQFNELEELEADEQGVALDFRSVVFSGELTQRACVPPQLETSGDAQ
jgi:gluconate kinase